MQNDPHFTVVGPLYQEHEGGWTPKVVTDLIACSLAGVYASWAEPMLGKPDRLCFEFGHIPDQSVIT